MRYSRKIRALALLLCVTGPVVAQKAEREYLRKGNQAYRKESYLDAEINYRKVLEVTPFSPEGLYNLGNAMALQAKDSEAMELYMKAAERCRDNPKKQAMIYHNIGDLYMASGDYMGAVEAFKQSLRNDPTDDMTRYNLALAQKLLKENPPQSQDQQQQQQENQDQQNQDQQQKEQEKNNPQEEDQKQDQMSQETAEQLLRAAMQDEQRLREKMKQEAPSRGGQLEKDW